VEGQGVAGWREALGELDIVSPRQAMTDQVNAGNSKIFTHLIFTDSIALPGLGLST
jgi:hypothetical protein